jgi:hypothetical protein
MTRLLLTALIVASLAACNRDNMSDDPENATDAAPSTATPSATTADTMPPTGNDSADATATTTGTMGTDPATTSDASALGTDAATGMTGQTDATLDADLRQCDTLPVTEAETCRTDARTRYEQRAASGTVDEATPIEQP